MAWRHQARDRGAAIHCTTIFLLVFSKGKPVPSTLVIIDMQPEFEASNSFITINACKREILKSKSKDEPILFVEYADDYEWSETYCEVTSPTHACLTELALGYKKAQFVSKMDSDGSNEVVDVINSNKLPNTLRICGVNADCCVSDTVVGINSKLDCKIHLIADAINNYSVMDTLSSIEHRREVLVYLQNIQALCQSKSVLIRNKRQLLSSSYEQHIERELKKAINGGKIKKTLDSWCNSCGLSKITYKVCGSRSRKQYCSNCVLAFIDDNRRKAAA